MGKTGQHYKQMTRPPDRRSHKKTRRRKGHIDRERVDRSTDYHHHHPPLDSACVRLRSFSF